MQLGNPGIILFSFWIRFLWACNSLFFSQHGSFKWKYSLKTVGNTTKKKKKGKLIKFKYFHLIRKKNILVKCWITGGEIKQSSGFDRTPQQTSHPLFKGSVLDHTPCWGSQFLTSEHLWSSKHTVCGTNCSKQPGWKLVLLKASAAFHVWPRQDSLMDWPVPPAKTPKICFTAAALGKILNFWDTQDPFLPKKLGEVFTVLWFGWEFKDNSFTAHSEIGR